MADLKKLVGRIAADLESQYEKRRVAVPDWTLQPVRIIPYRSYGTTSRLFLRARVLADPPLTPVTGNESRWRNLAHALQRLESDEIAGAVVRANVAGKATELRTDDEGYIVGEFPIDVAPPDSGWFDVPLTLEEPKLSPQVMANAAVLIPPGDAEYGVISDLDDTVIQSNVTSKLSMLRTVLFGNARSRTPFEGVAHFYRALRAGSSGEKRNPIFYVSGGPWNFYDVYEEFLAVQEVPPGPILLADFGIAAELFIHPEHQLHKKEKITHIVETYPELSFVLIGDSGEQDPEIYLDVVRQHPGRVKVIYIRDVTAGSRAAALKELGEQAGAAGADLVVVTGTAEAMADAVKRGLIRR